MTLTSLSYCYEEQAKASTERSMLSRYRHDFVSSGRNFFGLASCVRSLTGQRWGTAARYQSPCYSWWQLTGASLWCYSSWVRLHGRWTWHGIWRTSIPSLGSPAFTSLRPLELGLAALSDSVRTPVTWGIVYHMGSDVLRHPPCIQYLTVDIASNSCCRIHSLFESTPTQYYPNSLTAHGFKPVHYTLFSTISRASMAGMFPWISGKWYTVPLWQCD